MLAGQTLTKYGGDAQLAIENLAMPQLAEPEDPPENATATAKKIWEKRINEFVSLVAKRNWPRTSRPSTLLFGVVNAQTL